MKLHWLFISIVAIIIFQLLIYTSHFSNRANWVIYDYLSQYKSSKTSTNHHTVIIEIDEKSLKSIGQWPWPRVMTAQLLKKLHQYKPQSITLDILFVENDRTSLKQIKQFYLDFFGIDVGISGLPEMFLDNDNILEDAISVTNTILPIYLSYQENFKNACKISSFLKDEQVELTNLIKYKSALCSLPKIHNTASFHGFMNAFVDSDGRYRRTPLALTYNKDIVPALAMTPLVKLFPQIQITPISSLWGDFTLQALDKKIYLGEDTNVLLNFYPRQWYHTISAVDILTNNFDPQALVGKHLFVGSTAEGIQNLYNVAEDKKLPGIHTYATFLENFFNGELKVEPSKMKMIMIALSIIISLIMMTLLFYSRFLYAIALFLVSLISVSILSFILFESGIYSSLGYFILPFMSTFIILMSFYTIINFIEQKNFYKNLSTTLEMKVKERTKDLKEAKEKVESLHKATQDSIKFASFIQKALLPNEELFEKYFQEYFVKWNPRDTIGGDIYFLEELKKDEEVVLFVIDCTSHGVPGALITILVKAVEEQIKSYLLKYPDKIDPSYILQEFNINIKTLLKQYDKDSISDVGFDGGILCYNKKTGKLLYSGANTSLFTLKDKKVTTYKGDRHSIGYIRSNPEFKFKVQELDSSMIESLYISTDGYLDQKGGEKGFPFGKKKFVSFLESLDEQPLKEQAELFQSMIQEYQGDQDNTDDMTLIGLKV